MAADEVGRSPIVDAITAQYPALAGHSFAVVDSRGKRKSPYGADIQLEFYPPDERDNPVPGRPTIELFNERLQGPMLERAVFGDMLHHLPRVDPTFETYRQKFAKSITPDQLAVDRREWADARARRGEKRSFDQWMDQSRLDAYLRGYLAPDAADDWRNVYSPQQRQILDETQRYLRTPRQSTVAKGVNLPAGFELDQAQPAPRNPTAKAKPPAGFTLDAPRPGLAGSVMQPIANKDTFEGTADFGTLVKAHMVDDPETKLRIFAKARFPNLSDAEALGRYAFVGDDAVYRGDDGKLYRESPPGFLGWIKENLGAGSVANALPIAGSTIGGIAGVPGGPAGVAAGAGLGGAAGKGYNRVLANLAFDEPQTVGGNAADMAIEGVVDAATAGAGAKAGQLLDRRRQVRDLAKMDRVATATLHNQADARGIQLTPAELTNLPSLKAQQKTLSNVPQSADVMDEFLGRRAQQVQDATYRELANISAQDSAEVAARRGVEAAGEAIDAAVKQRAAAAGPIYREAFEQTAGIPQNMVGRINGLRARLPANVQERAAELARLEGLDINQAGNTLQGMHYMKMALDDLIKEGDLQGMGAARRRAIVGVKNDLVSFMDDISAKDAQGRSLYKLARDIYSASSPTVESTKQGLTGAVAGKLDRNATQALDQLFSAERSGPIAVSKARREIMAQDEDAWNGMLRAYLQQKFEKAGAATANSSTRPMQGAIFRAQMVGNKKQAEILSAAMDGKQWRSFNDLMDVLEATGRVKVSGSDTAWNQEAMRLLRKESGGSLDNLIDPLGTPRRAVEWLREVRLGNHAEKLADIITSPQGMQQLKYLKTLSPNDQRFIAGTAALLGASASPSSADKVPPELQLRPR